MGEYRKVKLYLMIILTGIFFGATLLLSHITHSLVLLIDSYHMLHNVFALIVSLVAEKVSMENSLKNTFGWARIEVLGLLVNSLFLGALCFSILVEALQTMIHADHSDAMHQPLVVLVLGIIEFFLNLLCFFLLGGYSHNNKCFLTYQNNDLQVSVVLNSIKCDKTNEKGKADKESSNSANCQKCNKHNSDSKEILPLVPNLISKSTKLINNQAQDTNDVEPCQTTASKTDNAKDTSFFTHKKLFILTIIRDFSGSLLIMACSLIVYLTRDEVALFADPVLSLISVTILTLSSYPLLKETGLILLQTVPQNIDVETIKSRLLKQFPEVLNIHDFHVWRLTASTNIATAHIICLSPACYKKVARNIDRFFATEGFNSITVQPEFRECALTPVESTECILECSRSHRCSSSTCCGTSVQRRRDNKFKSSLETLTNIEDLSYLEANLNLTEISTSNFQVDLMPNNPGVSEENLHISTVVIQN